MSRICAGLANVAVLLLLGSVLSSVRAQEDVWTALRQGGAVVLMRHAVPNREYDAQTLLRSEDCAGRRWLSEDGLRQASAMGERLRQEGVTVAMVLTSPLCPARGTAEALGLGTPEVNQGLRIAENDQSVWSTRAADVLRHLIVEWRGPGTLVLVTHLGNIARLIGARPDPGEGFVLRPAGSGLRLVGRVSLE